MSIPRLTLIGAGPGDPDLLSIKGMKALAQADVVLYDALVHPDLLAYAPANVIKKFVGKRPGLCEFSQQDINELIVSYALRYGHVVRLKGGDPFVFGRGYEEMVYARSFNVATQVIPGISSCIAVPESQHIPLTCRGINESFWVLTGTTLNHEFSKDISVAAQSSATLVILMGMKNLRKITEVLSSNGKAGTPVAIIQQGTLPEERIAIGTVHTIADIAEEQNLQNPAIIVIGEVVTLHPQFIKEEALIRYITTSTV